MFDNIIIGQYLPGHSVFHRLDPRSKLIALFLFLIFLFLGRSPYIIVGGFTLVMTVFLISRVPLIYFLKGLRPIAILLTFTFLMHALFNQTGSVLLSTGWITITTEGIWDGALIAGRLLVLVVFASLLTLTTTPIDLTDGLEQLMQPLKKVKFPVHELALMMSIALRFIPTLLDETARIMKAQMARGARFNEGSLWNRLKSLVPIFVPLFIQAFKRAEDLATAMEARGYAGGEGRTKYRQLSWSYQDTVYIGIILCFGLFASLIAFT